ncbi:hypothetical protein C8R46DRAFT_1212483 [Mycena filopes]|nr:hypothetical protein C8R46DRAFT_1212483 [Mycena filopes]
MSGLEDWPFSIPVHSVYLANTRTVSLFASHTVVIISGAGLSCVTLSVESDHLPLLKIRLNIHSRSDITVNKETLSWSVSIGRYQPVYELRFPTLRVFEAFLFALCFVRYIQAKGLSAAGITKAHNAVKTATDDRYLQALTDIFVDLRTTNAEVKFGSPLVLLQVCVAWRTVAIDTSGLWRTASFVLGRSFLAHDKNHHAQMAAWLARAKTPTAALSITVDASHNVPHEAFHIPRHNPTLFASVRTLRISSPQSQLPHLLGGVVMSALESLSITIPEDLPQWLPGLQLGQSVPNLHNLTIIADGLRVSDHGDPGLVTAIPWLQLRKLNMKLHVNLSVWMAILSQCTALISASFVVCNDGSPYSIAPVTFPHLESLRVTFRGICETDSFDHLTFPVLRVLHLSGIAHPHQRTRFLPQFPTLHAFSIDIPHFHLATLEAVVRSHSKLQQIGFIIDREPASYTALFQLLQRECRLRTLTVSTPTGDYSKNLREHITTWACEQASISGCKFRLFGRTAALQALKHDFAQVPFMQSDYEFNPVEDFADPFAVFSYSRMLLLNVRRQ